MTVLDEQQKRAWDLIHLIWPHETVERHGLALGEEAGEVQRAILKREHARDGDGDRASERDWYENLRVEIGQAAVVLASLAEREGISLTDAIGYALVQLEQRADALGLSL